MDEARKHEIRIIDAAIKAARDIRPSLLIVWEAATIGADQTTDPAIRNELLTLKQATGDTLAAIDEWLAAIAADPFMTIEDDAGAYDEPPDPQDEKDRRDYEAGKAEGELRRAEREIYGDKLAERFHAQDDLNAYNRGEE